MNFIPNRWLAEPLSASEKQVHFQETKNLRAAGRSYGRFAFIGSFILVGVAAIFFLASALIATVVIATKNVKHELWVGERDIGRITRAVSLDEIPKPNTFTEANDMYYIKQYILAHESWVWETDKNRDRIVKIMSFPEEQNRYLASRKKSVHPSLTVGKNGHVLPDNIRFHREPDGRNMTRSYKAYVDLVTSWNDGREEKTPVTISVDFQWHPELLATPEDHIDNPGGMLVLAYSVNPDVPDVRKQ